MKQTGRKNVYFDKSEVIDDYYRNYAQNVAPILDELEKQRKIELTKLLLCIATVIILTKLCIQHFGESLFINCFIFGGLTIVFVAYFITHNYNSKIKTSCMKKLISCFGDIKWGNGIKAISDYDIEKSELFGTYNKRSDDDSFIGSYKGVEYKICETNLVSQTSGRRKLVWPVFNGVIINFASNKVILNKTIITTKGDLNVRNSNPLIVLGLIMSIGYILTIVQPSFYTPTNLLYFLAIGISLFFLVNYLVIKYNNTGNEKLNEITLEDPEFCKKFQAYSSDEIEARYLVTTAFMKRFQNLRTAFGVRRAKCAFYDDNIMIALSTNKNLFEIGSIFAPVNKTKQINIFLSEISAIFDLIDYFKLNEKTGI